MSAAPDGGWEYGDVVAAECGGQTDTYIHGGDGFRSVSGSGRIPCPECALTLLVRDSKPVKNGSPWKPGDIVLDGKGCVWVRTRVRTWATALLRIGREYTHGAVRTAGNGDLPSPVTLLVRDGEAVKRAGEPSDG